MHAEENVGVAGHASKRNCGVTLSSHGAGVEYVEWKRIWVVVSNASGVAKKNYSPQEPKSHTLREERRDPP